MGALHLPLYQFHQSPTIGVPFYCMLMDLGGSGILSSQNIYGVRVVLNKKCYIKYTKLFVWDANILVQIVKYNPTEFTSLWETILQQKSHFFIFHLHVTLKMYCWLCFCVWVIYTQILKCSFIISFFSFRKEDILWSEIFYKEVIGSPKEFTVNMFDRTHSNFNSFRKMFYCESMLIIIILRNVLFKISCFHFL